MTLEATNPSVNAGTAIASPIDRPTAGELLNQVSAVYDRARDNVRDARELHRRVHRLQFDELMWTYARREPSETLRELSRRYGLSWSLIARLVGVSATAVRKWRAGEAVSPASRQALSRLAALLALMTKLLSPIAEPASWLEMPISDRTMVTPADLFAAGGVQSVIELAAGQIPSDAVLDEFDPEWRARTAPDRRFEVVVADDGLPAIRVSD